MFGYDIELFRRRKWRLVFCLWNTHTVQLNTLNALRTINKFVRLLGLDLLLLKNSVVWMCSSGTLRILLSYSLQKCSFVGKWPSANGNKHSDWILQGMWLVLTNWSDLWMTLGLSLLDFGQFGTAKRRENFPKNGHKIVQIMQNCKYYKSVAETETKDLQHWSRPEPAAVWPYSLKIHPFGEILIARNK